MTTGLGWLIGGPIGGVMAGGATYLLKKLTQDTESKQPVSSNTYLEDVQKAYNIAAQDYLTRFSQLAFSILDQYQKTAETIINIQPSEEPQKMTIQHYQLQLLQTLLDNLNQELELVSAKLST